MRYHFLLAQEINIYLKAITASEGIEYKVFEDLFSSFSSLYYALANDFGTLICVCVCVFGGNKLTYTVLSIADVQTIKGGICKAQSKINFDLGKKC